MLSSGDSYSDSHFDPAGAQPSPQQPLGNGNNVNADTAFVYGQWITDLTLNFNASSVLTYNLAKSGSVLDKKIVTRNSDIINDQINGVFKDDYAGKKDNGDGKGVWKPKSTLFTFFVGVNDVEISAENSDEAERDETMTKVFASFAQALQTLYEAGARNFLFLGAPAMNLGPGARPELKTIVPDFNDRLKSMVQDFQKSAGSKLQAIERGGGGRGGNADAVTTFFFDTAQVFDEIIKDTAVTEDTKGITITDKYCDQYTFSHDEDIAANQEKGDYKGEGCDGTFAQYFWKDGLHIMSTVHRAIARQVAKGLSEDGGRDAAGGGGGGPGGPCAGGDCWWEEQMGVAYPRKNRRGLSMRLRMFRGVWR